VATLDRLEAAEDRLDGSDQLEEWLAGAGLPSPVGGVTDADVASVRELRDAIGAVARAIASGGVASAEATRVVNSYARRPTPVFLLRPGARQRVVLEEVDLSASLSVVARDAVHMFSGANVSRLRECARTGCSTLFLDRSPSGLRRWCSMKGCGEIVASATYRRRRSAAEQ
jgi:predicted RNA-binding Zn ribbon-like protein